MDWLSVLINFDDFSRLLPLVKDPLLSAVILGVISGLMGPMIQARDLAFAVHGTSELSFTGAAFALFMGFSVTLGALVGSVTAAVILALMGVESKNRNMVIGIMLPAGLGLGVLFISLYGGRSSNKFGLLTGQIVSADVHQFYTFLIMGGLVAAVLGIFGRRMFFAAIDPALARAQGINTRLSSLLFMVLLGFVTAMSVQMVGALLVMALLITPAAAAARVTASPVWLYTLSVVFAVVSAVGGILLSLGPGLPISPYITTLSFLIYLVCWAIGAARTRRGWARRG